METIITAINRHKHIYLYMVYDHRQLDIPKAINYLTVYRFYRPWLMTLPPARFAGTGCRAVKYKNNTFNIKFKL